MRFDLITLFPEMLAAVRDQGVTGRAYARGTWSLGLWNPRDFTEDVHRTVDDRPYGGGPGMVMLAEPLMRAVNAAQAARALAAADAPTSSTPSTAPVVLLSPTGRPFDQEAAQAWSQSSGAIFICGRYEGVDQRLIDRHVTHEISLGDYVLSGGELGAMVIMDSIVRLLPGVLHDAQSAEQDSFNPALTGLLDSPHYTRPEIWGEQVVPPELLSGHHAQIARWRRQQSLTLTLARRPDLIEAARARGELSKDDEAWLGTLDAAS